MDLTELISQAPGVAAILIVVGWFLKALAKRDCALKDVTDVIRANSKALGANSEVLRETTSLLRTMNGKH